MCSSVASRVPKAPVKQLYSTLAVPGTPGNALSLDAVVIMSGRVSAMSDIVSFRQYEGRRKGLKGGQIPGCMDKVSLMVCDTEPLSMSLLDALMELVRTKGVVGGGGMTRACVRVWCRH